VLPRLNAKGNGSGLGGDVNIRKSVGRPRQRATAFGNGHNPSGITRQRGALFAFREGQVPPAFYGFLVDLEQKSIMARSPISSQAEWLGLLRFGIQFLYTQPLVGFAQR
jgi:hypothetical protein